jgi:hypothetical protein
MNQNHFHNKTKIFFLLLIIIIIIKNNNNKIIWVKNKIMKVKMMILQIYINQMIKSLMNYKS